MSYTLIVRSTSKSGAIKAIDASTVDDTDDPRLPATDEQLEALKKAVEILLPVVGAARDHVTIELAGNAQAAVDQDGNRQSDEVVHLVIRAAVE